MANDEERRKHEERLALLAPNIERSGGAGQQNRAEAAYHVACLSRLEAKEASKLHVWTFRVAVIAAVLSAVQLVVSVFN